MPVTVRRTRVTSLLGVAAVGWAALSALAVPVRADSIFSASADAAAVRTSFADATVVPLLTGGGTDVTTPRAQAVGNSLGTSQALASAMYPGDDVASLADLLGLVIPPTVPVPPPDVQFPLLVKADSNTPTPPDQTSPGYTLHARLGDGGTAQGSAISGASPVLSPGASSRSTAEVDSTADEGVRAVAETRTTGFALPGLVTLASVSTRATASRSGTGELARDADMAVTGGQVLGLPLELRNGSFVVPVLGQSIDVNHAIQSLPVLKPLKDQGVTLEYQAAVTSPNGITAPGIRVTWVHEVPALPLPSVPLPPLTPGQPNVGPIPASTATVTYSIGFASAQASLTAFPSFSDAPSSGGDAVAPAVGPVGAAGAPAGALDAGAPPLQPATGATDPVPSVAGPAAGPVRAVRRTRLAGATTGTSDLADIYLVLVVAGLLAIGAGQLMRFQGVRTAQA